MLSVSDIKYISIPLFADVISGSNIKTQSPAVYDRVPTINPLDVDTRTVFT